ncbi:hypothetical protein ACFXG4_47765 [Nocardia sp. NPDC059246]|uniref:hypothetical protein n=1 Tax=unclassified Nocardia TaxID=2637762 RepID=UPI00367BFD19
MRNITAFAAIAIGAVGIASAPASADPAAVPQPAPVTQPVDINGIHYTLDRDGDSLVVKSTDGHFSAVDGRVVITDGQGKTVDSLPLAYRKDASSFPITAEITGDTLRLTPDTVHGTPVTDPITPQAIASGTPIDQANPKDIAESFTPRDQQELSAFGSRTTLASLTGTVLGAIVGGGLGCVAGAIVGSVTTAVTTLFTGILPGAVIGCIAGVALVGTASSLAGAAFVGGPILLWSAYQYFSTILSPCTTPGNYCTDPAQPPVAKP